MSMVRESIDVEVPLHTAYRQWTRFEEFPRFMEGVDEVRRIDERRTHWRTSIAGAKREFDTEVIEQRPDERVSWHTVGGDVRQMGMVTFRQLADGRTRIGLAMDFQPQGMAERTGDLLGLVDRRVRGDLTRFKAFVEGRGRADGTPA
ncbi:SRPBCC family protein [Kitasatospora sp. NPDC088346]|uniref:SRPBCC family protein n=1 Tax=Kitasatospora sp. NPDC088346 TaxID=3364073 RepID=UPI0037F873CE